MAEPYVGEIRLFGGGFAPLGWALCDGSTIPIAGNETLYSLIGTSFGGDGNTTFGLPDLRGRAPVHSNPPGGYHIGLMDGSETVALGVNNLPAHGHDAVASTSTAAPLTTPVGNLLGPVGKNSAGTQDNLYIQKNPDTAMAPAIGGGAAMPHNNMQPFQVITYIIALDGVWPPQG